MSIIMWIIKLQELNDWLAASDYLLFIYKDIAFMGKYKMFFETSEVLPETL